MPLIAVVGFLESAVRDAGLVDTLLSFSQNAAALFVAMLWQGAIVALGLTICLRFTPRISAVYRFGIWGLGFAAVALLPSLSVLSFATAGIVASAPGYIAETASKPWFRLDARWGVAIAALWLLAFFVRAMSLAIHGARLHRLWKSATPIEPGVEIPPSVARSTRIRGRRTVQICTTRSLQRPSVIGFFAPRILIPDWLLSRLTPGELEQIVLHEAEHLRRRDDWTNLLQKVGMVFFPLNPGLWWMERKLCLEREMACDEEVVRVTHAPRAYAACLANLAERGLEQRAEALSLGAWQRRPELVRRVQGILLRKHRLGTAASVALMGVMSGALLLGSLELSRSPQLITFNRTRSVESAHAAGPTPARLVRASAIHAPCQWVPQRGDLARSYALQAKATPRTARADTFAAKAATTDKSVRKSTVPGAQLSISELPSMPARERMAHIEAYETLQDASSGEQWIMLTTVEQTQSSKIAGQQTSDFVAEDNADRTTSEAHTGQVGNAPSKLTVTRLILRVVPADSLPFQSGAIRFREGWFVIQL